MALRKIFLLIDKLPDNCLHVLLSCDLYLLLITVYIHGKLFTVLQLERSILGVVLLFYFSFFIGGEEAGWMYDCIGPEEEREKKKRLFLFF